MNYSVRLSRPVAQQIAEDLRSIPATFEPVAGPTMEQQDAAIAAYRGMFASPTWGALATEGE